VRLDDRITISTPEGVDMEIALAGVGSRAIAGLLDLTIEAFVVLSLFLAFSTVGTGGNGFVAAGFFIVLFLVLFGYFVLFEMLNHGRTPGKMAAGLRVVRIDGGPVTFIPSAVRNLLRLIDGWDLLTLVLCPIGTIAVIATKDNQRLGDLAAGTVVARERFATPRALLPLAPVVASSMPGWDVSAITSDEMVTVRRFLDRRGSINFNARVHLADDLAARLRPKVGGADPTWPSESFLEALAAAKSGRT
jgi:uncharacterized RDD family membrane protein YckC